MSVSECWSASTCRRFFGFLCQRHLAANFFKNIQIQQNDSAIFSGSRLVECWTGIPEILHSFHWCVFKKKATPLPSSGRSIVRAPPKLKQIESNSSKLGFFFYYVSGFLSGRSVGTANSGNSARLWANSVQVCVGSLGKSLISRPNFNEIQLTCTSIDSSLKALQNVFWNHLDTTKHSIGKLWKRADVAKLFQVTQSILIK